MQATTSRFPRFLDRAREKFQLFQDGRPVAVRWALLMGFLLSLFFVYRLTPIPIWISLPAAIATAAILAGLLLIVFGKLILRYQSGKSLILELVLGAIFCLILAWDGAGLTTVFWALVFLILLALFILRKRLNFYVLFSGLTLFALVFLGFRIVDWQKAGVVAIHQMIWKAAITARYSYEVLEDNGLIQVRSPQGNVLTLNLPDGVYLHDSDKLEEANGPGLPILGLSSHQERLDRIPSAILYRIPPGMDREGVRNRTELLLGTVKDEQVQDLKKEKEQSLFPPDFPVTMQGSFWTYYDRFEADTLRTGFFIFGSDAKPGSARSASESPNFLLWIREPVEKGFPFHPRTLELLRGISLPEVSTAPVDAAD